MFIHGSKMLDFITVSERIIPRTWFFFSSIIFCGFYFNLLIDSFIDLLFFLLYPLINWFVRFWVSEFLIVLLFDFVSWFYDILCILICYVLPHSSVFFAFCMLSTNSMIFLSVHWSVWSISSLICLISFFIDLLDRFHDQFLDQFLLRFFFVNLFTKRICTWLILCSHLLDQLLALICLINLHFSSRLLFDSSREFDLIHLDSVEFYASCLIRLIFAWFGWSSSDSVDCCFLLSVNSLLFLCYGWKCNHWNFNYWNWFTSWICYFSAIGWVQRNM